MSIAPVIASVTVALGQTAAFDLFTRRISEWWQQERTIAARPWVEIVLEPRVGGRWFERDAEGTETPWGEVVVWDPPARLLLAWRVTAEFRFDPDFETEVELRFEAEGAGSTRVTLEHRHLERFGPSAEIMAGRLGGGWPTLLARYEELTKKETM